MVYKKAAKSIHVYFSFFIFVCLLFIYFLNRKTLPQAQGEKVSKTT